jgi:hypothetical protein
MRARETYTAQYKLMELMLNFGVWSAADDDPDVFHKMTRRLEERRREPYETKFPDAATFCTEEECRGPHDRDRYVSGGKNGMSKRFLQTTRR